MRDMRVDSWKFWLILLSLIAFDVVVVQLWLFRPALTHQVGDFRIAELRQLEAEGKYTSLQPIRVMTTSSASDWQNWKWLGEYFPGQSVAGMAANSWHVIPLPAAATSPDSRGQVL